MNVEELRKDLEELKKFHEQATRPAVIKVLLDEVKRIEKQISGIETAAKESTGGSGDGKVTPKTSVVKEIKTYAWDQSAKFMKIYVSDCLEGVQDIPAENIEVEYKHNSCKLKVNGLKGRDYVCHIAPLYANIAEKDSKHKVKKDQVLLMLKKSEEGKTWAEVTGKGEKAPKPEPKGPESEAKDPSEGLMEMMKKMYDEGDDEMKRTISKAWQESQNKKGQGQV